MAHFVEILTHYVMISSRVSTSALCSILQNWEYYIGFAYFVIAQFSR